MQRSRLIGAGLIGALALWASPAVAGDASGAAAQAVPLVLQLGLLFAVARAGGLAAERLRVPPVLGEIAAGVIAGPRLLGGVSLPGFADGVMAGTATVLTQGGELRTVAVFSLMVLLFLLGIETDVRRVRRNLVTAAAAGLGGTVITLLAVGGFVWVAGTRLLALEPGRAALAAFCAALAATASSVGVAARVLARQRRLERPESVGVMAAAVVDNLMAVGLLAVACALTVAPPRPGPSLLLDAARTAAVVLLVMGLLAAVCGALARRIWRHADAAHTPTDAAAFALAAALTAGGVVAAFGLAPMAAAYAVGLALATTAVRHVVQERLEFLHAAFIPACFALLGMQLDPADLVDGRVLLAAAGLTAAVFVGKFAGAGLPAAAAGFTRTGCLRLGAGLLPRGEACLALAAAGLALGGITPALLMALVLMTAATDLLAPALIRSAFRMRGPGVRRALAPREDTRLLFRFPSLGAAGMVVGRLIEVLEDEGFFVHLLNRRDALYQVCRDATVASLRREGTNVVVDCAASDRSFFHAALIEVLAGIERNLREIRQPLVAADLQRSALSERPPAATPGARLRDYLAVDALRPRLLAEDKDGVIAELVDLLDEQGAVRDRQAALRAVMDREEGLSTGLQHGLALPHGRTDAVTRLVCAVGLKPEGVEFGSLDERPARIVVLALAPAGAAAPQIQFISLISQVLDEKGRAALLACDTPEDMYAVLTGLSPAGAAARRTRPAGALDCLQWHNIALDLSARTKEEVIDQLLALCARSGGVVSLAEARQAICQREARASTAIEYGIALPHAVTEAVDRLVCAVGISRPGVAFGAADGAPSRLFIMTLLPPSVTTAYTHLTGAILRALGPEGREALFAARSGQEALAVLKRGETGGGRSG